MSFEPKEFCPSGEVMDPLGRRLHERHLTTLRVAKLVTPGSETLCRIRTISSGGLRAETSALYAVGQSIEIELRPDHRLAGSVVWSHSGNVGVRFDECVSIEQVLSKSVGDKKLCNRQPRIPADCTVQLIIAAVSCRAPAIDISQGGIKVSLERPGIVGEPATIAARGLPGVEGVVRWSIDGQTGISFNGMIPFERLSQWLGTQLRIS